MQCPSDGTVLVMSERSGVEIDYCPTCRGVWLDRGELDKILDRAAQEFRPAATPPPAAPMAPPMAPPAPAYGQQDDRYRDSRSRDRDRDDRYDSGYNNNGYNNSAYNNGYGKKKKRDNWLSELFD